VNSEQFSFEVGSATTSAVFYRADVAGVTLVLGHGAGAPQTHPWMVKMAHALAARRIDVVTFNFLYSEAKRRVPDKNDVLEATWRAAIDSVLTRTGRPATSPEGNARATSRSRRLFIGGKSMGGRIATQVASKGGLSVSGLVLLGYPLHPPGKPAQLRAAHLPGVPWPMLFVQGSRDVFGTPDELRPVVERLSEGSRMFVVEGGDHSLSRPKASGESLEGTLSRVAEEIADFTSSR
jgi:predicted alpha/beta-hydrolase family hydrolase